MYASRGCLYRTRRSTCRGLEDHICPAHVRVEAGLSDLCSGNPPVSQPEGDWLKRSKVRK